MSYTRKYKITDVRAGCITCDDITSKWEGTTASRCAREHHKKTGHEVWIEIITGTRLVKVADHDDPET